MSDETQPKKEPRSLKIEQFVTPELLKRDLAYSMTDLTSAMMEQASRFADYGVLAAKASRQVNSAKMLMEVAESKVYRALRDKAAEEGVKVTEAKLEKEVAVHPQVIALRQCLNEAKQIEAVAKTAVEAFRHRRDMLVQHGLISREEMKGELSISRRNAADEERQAQERRILERMRSPS